MLAPWPLQSPPIQSSFSRHSLQIPCQEKIRSGPRKWRRRKEKKKGFFAFVNGRVSKGDEPTGWRFCAKREGGTHREEETRGDERVLVSTDTRPNRIRSGSKSHCSRDKKGCGFSVGGREGGSYACFCCSLFISPLARSSERKVGTNSCRLAIAQRPFGAGNCQKVTPMSQLMRSRPLCRPDS